MNQRTHESKDVIRKATFILILKVAFQADLLLIAMFFNPPRYKQNTGEDNIDLNSLRLTYSEGR